MNLLKNYSKKIDLDSVARNIPTPCRIRTHTAAPVPFIIYKPGKEPDNVQTYDEFSVEEGYYGLLSQDEFIKELFKKD